MIEDVRRSACLGLLVGLLACGGQVSSAGDAGGSSGSSSGSASEPEAGGDTGSGSSGSSSGVAVPLCPLDPPDPGSSCAEPGTQGCVYLEPGGCRAFVCDANGAWETTTQGC